MVKKNKLLIGCLSLLLVLSVGYALFSETITINGTATAKGSFDITTTCEPGLSEDVVGYLGVNSTDEEQHGFENSICDVKDNLVTLTTDLLYPTAARYFTIKMTNKGSIPAIIWGAEDGKSVESLDIGGGASWFLKDKETDEIIKSVESDSMKVNSGIRTVISNITLPKFDATNNVLMDVIYDTEKQYAGIKLEPGESIYVIIFFQYPEEANELMNDNGKSEYFEFKLNHEFKWEQYTDNPNYEDANYGNFCFDGC